MILQIGLAPYIRLFLSFYLIYLVIIKKVKIPSYYFLIYSLASLIFLLRLIKFNETQFPGLHGFNTIYEMPLYHEAILSFIVNFLFGLFH
jgi:hypothetical protein